MTKLQRNLNSKILVILPNCDEQNIGTEGNDLNTTETSTQPNTQATHPPAIITKDDSANLADTSCNIHLQSVNVLWDQKTGRAVKTCTDIDCFRTYNVSVHVDASLVEQGAQLGFIRYVLRYMQHKILLMQVHK